MRKLYVVMVGLPARGKSTLARRICEALHDEGTEVAIFNNGETRRELMGAESTAADFFATDNVKGQETRQKIAELNMDKAKAFLMQGGAVAILDATNVGRERRRIILERLTDHPVLFIECINEDNALLEVFVESKCQLAEFQNMPDRVALQSFYSRIAYYEERYTPVGIGDVGERYWMRVDAAANRILQESPCDGSPHYSAIRDVVVSTWVRNLYLVRHGQTHFNLEGRIGGDPDLTDKGLTQAYALARHLKETHIPWIFTSTRKRSYQMAAPLRKGRNHAHHALAEFDEIWAGTCENMLYEDIRNTMPHISQARHADKYNFTYPEGESYDMLRNRVRRGIQRALFLAGDAPLLIVGHQAVNRVVLSLFLHQRPEDIPYIYIPQNQFYRISVTPRRKLFELIRFI